MSESICELVSPKFLALGRSSQLGLDEAVALDNAALAFWSLGGKRDPGLCQ